MTNIARRSVLAGSASLLATPAIIGRAVAATRGVTDTEIVIGMMTDLSGVTRSRHQCDQCHANGIR